MLSNFVIAQHKFALFIDNYGCEKHSLSILENLLKEQGQNKDQIINVSQNINLTNDSFLHALQSQINNEFARTSNKLTIILPSLTKLLIIQRKPSETFNLIHCLKCNSKINQIFLWASPQRISRKYLISYLEYMSDIIINIKDSTNLSILTRKTGGSITNKNYTYKTTEEQFLIDAIKLVKINDEPSIKPENLGTFKIEIEEDELVARNAVKLPYERQSEPEGNIIYIPDSDDDFDDEDPDEDLNI